MKESARNPFGRSFLTTLVAASALLFGAISKTDSEDKKEVQQLVKLTSPVVSRPAAPRELSLADRMAYQYAIEEVYWRHRLWPNGGSPKPSLDEAISATQVQEKVERYLRNSQLLEDQWQRPITTQQLQAEMERMA